MGFDWHDAKARRNARQHGVPFPEAATAFADDAALDLGPSDHSDTETRYGLIGRTDQGRIVTVSYTLRGLHADTFWIISAREASPRERRAYHATDRLL